MTSDCVPGLVPNLLGCTDCDSWICALASLIFILILITIIIILILKTSTAAKPKSS